MNELSYGQHDPLTEFCVDGLPVNVVISYLQQSVTCRLSITQHCVETVRFGLQCTLHELGGLELPL